MRGGVTRHGASADIEKGIFGKDGGKTTEEDKLGRKAGEKGEGEKRRREEEVFFPSPYFSWKEACVGKEREKGRLRTKDGL